VPPCRSLCEKVVNECSSTLAEFGINLPEVMMCHSFPSESEHTCIPIQSRSDPLPDGTLRWNNEENDEKSFFHSVGCPLAQRSVHKDWTFMEMEQCTQPCAPMHHDDHETFIIRLVVGLFASLTAVVSAFGIYIFMSETKRYVNM
jgi:hypothetical protein